SVDMTVKGFEEVIRALPKAKEHHRGERVVETAFFSVARTDGNDLGYDTIAACGNNATILHWIRNNGTVDDGKLLLLDAGVEDDTLYTADVTRTFPVNGKFTEVQAKVYNAVLEAADAAFAVAKPGTKFYEIHEAAMNVLAHRLEEWGLLPVSADVSLTVEGGQHRRWMPHGTSHHLGLDVHDCAQAKAELYMWAELEPGMVFTIEPALYFKDEDLSVPEEYRGIGIRLEDDVLCTEDGNVNLSAALPRTVEEIEEWMAKLSKEA
ncbi:MAG: M24B family metallopeptidase, partial [Staphylococcus sp.]|nr:M24B family metallopeptidase [Staphylococcus sp.]